MDSRSTPHYLRFDRSLWSLFLATGLLWLLLGPSLVFADSEIIYVKPGASGSGADWANATGLQNALSSATSGNEIWVAAGVYTPGAFITSTFVLTDGVVLYGGFAATETMRTQRDWQANPTVLSGDLENNDTFKDASGVVTSTTGITGTNAYHVVTGSGVTTTAVLDGFFITAGSAPSGFDSSCGPGCGGGMYNDAGSPTLTNLAFSGNNATEGGGMFNEGNSSPTLTNLAFSGNNATQGGGGMANAFGPSPTLINVTFSGNNATEGGGMDNKYSSNPTLTNVAFAGNNASNGGGGMANVNCNNPTLTNVTFAGNNASNGGGMYNIDCSLTLINVAFAGNNVTFDGGGMANVASNPTLTNVSLSGNNATEGGGMFNTFSSPLLQNTILWGNSATTSTTILNTNNSSPIILYSLIEGGLPAGAEGSDNLSGSLIPQFIRDPDPGDGDWTTLDDNDYGDLRLQPTSPAIDVGRNAADLDGNGVLTATISSVISDLAGLPRIVAVTREAPTVDLGAYETPNSPPAFVSGPPVTATQGVSYTYAISSTDANQPDTSLTLLAGAAWLGLSDNGNGSGTLSGTPTNADVGNHVVILQVQDSGGLTTTQSFTLTVTNVNDPPTFTSTPVTAATVGVAYSYTVTTSDPDTGDTRTITSLTQPGWLTLTDHGDGTATLSGTPSASDIGQAPLVLQVQDKAGLSANQSSVITVSATPVISGSIVGQVLADGVGVQGVTVTVNSEATTGVVSAAVVVAQDVTDAQGNYSFDGLTPGVYTLTFDPPAGYVTPDPVEVIVEAGQTQTVPDVVVAPVAGSLGGQLFLPTVIR
jgi:hypothetical protein